jgi:hypothetical protein
MPVSVQARLDPETQRALNRLVRRLGMSPSALVREGIRLLAACQQAPAEKKITGLGQFRSGIADLGSNKRHLRGFGRAARSSCRQ